MEWQKYRWADMDKSFGEGNTIRARLMPYYYHAYAMHKSRRVSDLNLLSRNLWLMLHRYLKYRIAGNISGCVISAVL